MPQEPHERQKKMTQEDVSSRLEDVQFATGEEQRNSSKKNEEGKANQKHHPVVGVSGGESKVWYCKEKYCIGTWNIRFMNQGKLNVVKHEMGRGNIDSSAITELKWTGIGEFNSDDHYIYYCGQETLRRNGVTLIVKKSIKCNTWVQSQILQNDLKSFPRQTIQHHSNPSLKLNGSMKINKTF